MNPMQGSHQQMRPQQINSRQGNVSRSMHGHHHGQASQRTLQNLSSGNFFENFPLSAGEKDALVHINRA